MRYLQKLIIMTAVVFTGTLIFSGCQALSEPPESQLKYFLSPEEDCKAPCWRTLQPGLSAEKDFLDLVDISDSGLFDDIKRTKLNPEGVEYSWTDNENGIFARVRIHEDRVSLFRFQPIENNISLSLITELHGEPSAYGASLLGSHNDYYVVLIMIYEHKGLVIEALFPINLPELQIINTTCEYEIDQGNIPEKLHAYLVEADSPELMMQNQYIIDFFSFAYNPLPWDIEEPIQLTSCSS